MKVECDIEDFLSTLKTFENQGVRVVSLDIDNELEGVKVTPIDKNRNDVTAETSRTNTKSITEVVMHCS